jgi:hypothetical protein
MNLAGRARSHERGTRVRGFSLNGHIDERPAAVNRAVVAGAGFFGIVL